MFTWHEHNSKLTVGDIKEGGSCIVQRRLRGHKILKWVESFGWRIFIEEILWRRTMRFREECKEDSECRR